ncbi:MAG TPA: hypothetical protein VLU91_02455 [Nitrososphaerales archaeon]|nr:hypothetical protein [Nitrososphaerales archaeon]
MEILGGEDLRKRMLDSYSKDPKGWTFVVSPSPDSGFFDATVSGREGSWLLKIDSLFKPYPIVLGSPAEPLQRRPRAPFSYGYRPLPAALAAQIMGEGGVGARADVRRRLLSVLGSEPVIPKEGGSYAEGPLVLAGPRETSLSDAQKEIDTKLASEMHRLLRLRYPSYG